MKHTYTQTYTVWTPTIKVYSIDERIEVCDMCTNHPIWRMAQEGVLRLCHPCQEKLASYG